MFCRLANGTADARKTILMVHSERTVQHINDLMLGTQGVWRGGGGGGQRLRASDEVCRPSGKSLGVCETDNDEHQTES